MLDTVQIRHAYHEKQPPEMFFLARKRGDVSSFVNNPPKGSHLPRLTWTNHARTGGTWLSAEVSLPKFYFGNNVQELNARQMEIALCDLAEYVEEKTGLPFDAATAIVGRFDPCRNFQCKDEKEVKERLKAYQRLTLAKYDRQAINDSTVTLFSRRKEFCVYSKFDDCHDKKLDDSLLKLAEGKLRFEPRYKNPAVCREYAKKKGVEPLVRHLLNPEVLKQTLRDSLSLLGMDKPVLTRENVYQKLVSIFGTRATNYYGFLKAREEFGDNFWRLGGISRATYFRTANELKKAGCWLVSEQIELPPLTIPDAELFDNE